MPQGLKKKVGLLGKATDGEKKPEDTEDEKTPSSEEEEEEEKNGAEENLEEDDEKKKDEAKAGSSKPSLLARAAHFLQMGNAKDHEISNLKSENTQLKTDNARLIAENATLGDRVKQFDELEKTLSAENEQLKEDVLISGQKIGVRAASVVAACGLAEEKLPESDSPSGIALGSVKKEDPVVAHFNKVLN